MPNLPSLEELLKAGVHFGHQKSKVSEFALQNLLVNFLEELGKYKPRASKVVKK